LPHGGSSSSLRFDVDELSPALERSEIAVIASPNHLHREQLERALEAGCDVLVEKPLATASEGMDGTLARARAEGRVVGVGNNLRFVEAIERARQILEEGMLGLVIRARADFGFDLRAWRPGRDFRDSYSARPEQGGGVLLDAIHEFDYLYWLFGDVRRVCCIAGSRSSLGLEVEDVACAVLDFSAGVVAEVALDYASGVYRRGFEIVGEEGVATWRWGDGAVVVVGKAESHAFDVRPADDMYSRLLDDFLGAVAERRDPRTSGDEGLAVLRVVEAAAEASHRGIAVEIGEVKG
jgi:predicted dehydrogenase